MLSSLLIVTYLIILIKTEVGIFIIPILWVWKLRQRDTKWLINVKPKQNYQFSLKINTSKIQMNYIKFI